VNDRAWTQRRLASEVARRKRAERKYDDLLAGIAKAVVIELRAAKYIEIHDQLPGNEAHP
jgi:hypothetical protein